MAGVRMWLKGLLLGAAIGSGAALLALSPPGIALEERFGLPVLFTIRGKVPPPPDVAVVAINPRAAEAMGLPPQPRNWPRSIHGELVDALVAHGASAIVFDLRFDVPQARDEDEAFATAVRRANRVVLLERMDKRLESFPMDGKGVTAVAATDQAVPPIEPLADAAAVIAPFLLPKTSGNINQFWAFWPGDGPVATVPTAGLWLHALRTDRSALPPIQALAVGERRLLPAGPAVDSMPSLRDMLVRVRRALAGRSDIVDAMEAGGDAAARLPANVLTRRLAAVFAGPDSRYLNFYIHSPSGMPSDVSFA